MFLNHLKRRNDGTKIKLNFLKLEKRDKLESLNKIIDKDLDIFNHYMKYYKIRDKDPKQPILNYKNALMALEIADFNQYLDTMNPTHKTILKSFKEFSKDGKCKILKNWNKIYEII